MLKILSTERLALAAGAVWQGGPAVADWLQIITDGIGLFG